MYELNLDASATASFLLIPFNSLYLKQNAGFTWQCQPHSTFSGELIDYGSYFK